MTAQPIKLIFGVDGGYSQHLAVTLVSLLENNRRNRFAILVVTLDMAEADRDRFRAVAPPFGNATLRFHPFHLARFTHFSTAHPYSPPPTPRIFIPNPPPQPQDKATP